MPHARWASVSIVAGTTFTINQTADNGAGAPRFRTTVVHDLSVNDVVLIAGTTDYNGEAVVTAVSDNTHFDVAALAFVSNQSGTVNEGTALTNAVDLAFGERIVALQLPSDWDATADVCFQVSRDGTDFLDLLDIQGNIIRVTNVGESEMRALANDMNAMDFPLGPHKVRLRSVNTGSTANVNQIETPAFYLLLAKG